MDMKPERFRELCGALVDVMIDLNATPDEGELVMESLLQAKQLKKYHPDLADRILNNNPGLQ